MDTTRIQATSRLHPKIGRMKDLLLLPRRRFRLHTTTEEFTMTHRLTTLICAMLLLSACSPNENPPPAPKLFEEQRDALDKAKAVDAEQQKLAEERRKAIEQQTQGN